ncbi:unnamed protein product [Mytilus edulis]|uniref:MAM domain-containing protein n=1 Tax=Mytilus edulis TaxID=6550 RepID=A0A8S3VFW9_MYTED|nr:unnamed protein product [Mytilus edulis]
MQVAENGTRLSTFEENYGDWMVDGTTWERNNLVTDHTRLVPGTPGFNIHVVSFSGRAVTRRIATDKEFMEPICLSHTNGNQTLLFTVDGNSVLFTTWINISVNVYGQDPFKIALESDFKQRDSTAVRSILIDDTSIAYRPCEGQQVHSACLNVDEPIGIKCETQHLANNSQTTSYVERSAESSTHFNAIAAGVGGGVLLIIIAVVVIYRVRRSKTGKQETSPGNANKAYDENQYDYAIPDGKQSADFYSMTDDGTYDISSNNKPRENQNDNNVYSHMSSDGTYYDVSSNSKHRENPNDNNLYSHWSGDGTYDVSSNNKKRENQIDDNIYSHKADDVYDSAGHHKLPDKSDETYDHFFGQQTEDEYDTTTRT